MIVVAGPRIDPATLAGRGGAGDPRVTSTDLYRHLAACDLAIVQGGLTTRDGADRQPAAVPLLPAAAPLRAALPRAAPARPLRRRADDGVRHRRAGRRSRTRSPPRSGASRTTAPSSRTAPRRPRQPLPSFCSVASMAIPLISVRHPAAPRHRRRPGRGRRRRDRLRGHAPGAPAQPRRRRDRAAALQGRRHRHLGQLLLPHRRPGRPDRPRGTLEVYEISAEDGSEINKRVIPIVFGRALVDPFTGFTIHTVAAGRHAVGDRRHVLRRPGEVPDHLRRQPQPARRSRRDRPGQVLRIPQ